MPSNMVYPTYAAALEYAQNPNIETSQLGTVPIIEKVPGGYQVISVDTSGERENTPQEYADLHSAMRGSFTSDPKTQFAPGEAQNYYPDAGYEDAYAERADENEFNRLFNAYMVKQGYPEYSSKNPEGAFQQGLRGRQETQDIVYGDRGQPEESVPTPTGTTDDEFVARVSRMRPNQARAYAADLMGKGLLPTGSRTQSILKMLGVSRATDRDKQIAEAKASPAWQEAGNMDTETSWVEPMPGGGYRAVGGDAMGNPTSLDSPVPSGMTIREVLERYGG